MYFASVPPRKQIYSSGVEGGLTGTSIAVNGPEEHRWSETDLRYTDENPTEKKSDEVVGNLQ